MLYYIIINMKIKKFDIFFLFNNEFKIYKHKTIQYLLHDIITQYLLLIIINILYLF